MGQINWARNTWKKIEKHTCFIQTLIKEWCSESNKIWFITPQHASLFLLAAAAFLIFWVTTSWLCHFSHFLKFSLPGGKTYYSCRTSLKNGSRNLVFWRLAEKKDVLIPKFPLSWKKLEALDQTVANTSDVLQQFYICRWEWWSQFTGQLEDKMRSYT